MLCWVVGKCQKLHFMSIIGKKIGLSQNNWDIKMTKSTILFLTTLLDFKKLKHILKKRKLIDFEKKLRNWPGETFPGQFLIKAKLFHHATNIKVTLSQKVFHSCSNLQREVQNHSPAPLFFIWVVLRGGILQLFFEIWAKVKKFLRLSHL